MLLDIKREYFTFIFLDTLALASPQRLMRPACNCKEGEEEKKGDKQESSFQCRAHFHSFVESSLHKAPNPGDPMQALVYLVQWALNSHLKVIQMPGQSSSHPTHT